MICLFPAVKSAEAKACSHVKASCAGVGGKANVAFTRKKVLLLQTHRKRKNNVWAAEALICLRGAERTIPPEPAGDTDTPSQSFFLFFFLLLSRPAHIKRRYCVKCQRKKEAREVISFSFLIASGIIGILLGSLHELPTSQKMSPAAPFHSCSSFENIAPSPNNSSRYAVTRSPATYIQR